MRFPYALCVYPTDARIISIFTSFALLGKIRNNIEQQAKQMEIIIRTREDYFEFVLTSNSIFNFTH